MLKMEGTLKLPPTTLSGTELGQTSRQQTNVKRQAQHTS